MSANQETKEEDERIFPILDRNTPILDRIKERRENLNGTGANNIAQGIAQSALTGESIDEKFLVKLRSNIASELEIPEDQINSMYISKVRDALSPSLKELVAQQQTGLQDPERESENSSENESDSQEEEDTNELEEESETDESTPVFPSESDEEQEQEDDDEPDSVF